MWWSRFARTYTRLAPRSVSSGFSPVAAALALIAHVRQPVRTRAGFALDNVSVSESCHCASLRLLYYEVVGLSWDSSLVAVWTQSRERVSRAVTLATTYMSWWAEVRCLLGPVCGVRIQNSELNKGRAARQAGCRGRTVAPRLASLAAPRRTGFLIAVMSSLGHGAAGPTPGRLLGLE